MCTPILERFIKDHFLTEIKVRIMIFGSVSAHWYCILVDFVAFEHVMFTPSCGPNVTKLLKHASNKPHSGNVLTQFKS